MGNDKRTFVVSNLHRDAADDINNDITITLPDSIFSGKIDAITMKHLYIDYDVETLGTSNNEFSISYPETSALVKIVLDLNRYGSGILRTDVELAELIESSINAALGTTVFEVSFNKNILFNRDIYRDNSDMLSNYTITARNSANFTIDFSSKTSIGPLIGFGNGMYQSNHTYKGGNIPPIYAYESIYVSNKAYDPTFKLYDQPSDFSCKMNLYRSDNTLITNYLDTRDTTISLPIVAGYINSAHELINYLEIELNRYSPFFDGAVFQVDFDYETYRFTISNDKDAKFGIGFRFDRGLGINSYGSLHRCLGFNKQNYLGIKSITSVQTARIFENAYIGEYLFICSDLIKYNHDASLILAESGGAANHYESIFTIPVRLIDQNGSYVPVFELEHRVRIQASKLAKLYNEERDDAKTINFYLKTSSGRHIKLNTQWSIKFDIEYIN